MNVSSKSRIRSYLFLTILLLTVALPAASGPAAAATDHQALLKTTLANGLTILINPNVDNEVVEFQAFVKMGQAYEGPSNYGVSALLQRVITRGSADATAQQIDNRLESYGAFLNTDVGPEYGELTLKCTGEVFAKCLPVVGEILLHPALPAAEVEKERQMLVREIAGSGDQPDQIVNDNFLKSFYGGGSYGIPARELGRSVAAIGRDGLLAWYQRVYTARNMVISVVGRVDAADLAKKLKTIFQKMPSGEALPLNAVRLPAGDENRVSYEVKETQALFMMLGYPAPDMFSPDWPAMTVLNWILGGGGMSSRLFAELREQKSLAYDVDSGYRKMMGPSYIAAFMATAPPNYEAARDGLLAAFQKLTVEKVSDTELANAKRAVRGRFVMAHETNAGRAGIAGRYELFGLGHGFEAQYPLLIDQISAADIQRVAQTYFRYYTLSVVSPKEIK